MECSESSCLKNEIMTNSERLMRYANDEINTVELANLIKNVGEHVNKMDELEIGNDSNVGKKTNESSDDFYSRLKNLYNKPLTSKKKDEKIVNALVESVFPTKPIDIESMRLNTGKKLRKDIDNGCGVSRNSKRVNFSKLLNEEIFCKDLMDNVNLPELIEDCPKFQREDDRDFVRCKVPTVSELPNDEEELEKLLKSYIDDIKPSWRRHRSGKPYPPGSKESVRSIDYRLANLEEGSDPQGAVTGGEVVCGCPEEIAIEGDEDSLRDIGYKLQQLKKNHNISKVTIRMKKVNKTVKESVDTKSKAKNYSEGPVLLTKYCLEKVCQEVAVHPKLTTLAVDAVPLSQSCQAILVPSFATLRELKLLGNKLGDEGVRTLCRYIWRSGNLRVLDLSNNEIGPAGVRELVLLLERRAVLRMMEPEFFGVERITINRNPIKYDGFHELLNAVGKDLWTKALDLRYCGLTRGGDEALRLVTNNRQIEVLDLRGNPLEAVGQVVRTVLKNCPPEQAEYAWHDKEDLRNYLE